MFTTAIWDACRKEGNRYSMFDFLALYSKNPLSNNRIDFLLEGRQKFCSFVYSENHNFLSADRKSLLITYSHNPQESHKVSEEESVVIFDGLLFLFPREFYYDINSHDILEAPEKSAWDLWLAGNRNG
jgi:hypothetical protein